MEIADFIRNCFLSPEFTFADTDKVGGGGEPGAEVVSHVQSTEVDDGDDDFDVALLKGEVMSSLSHMDLKSHEGWMIDLDLDFRIPASFVKQCWKNS
jgi:hypothetical protein